MQRGTKIRRICNTGFACSKYERCGASRLHSLVKVLRGQRTEEQATRLPHMQTTPSADGDMEECLILSNPKKYRDRASLWKAQDWDTAQTLEATKHKSRPYHDGCSTLARLMFSHVDIGAQEANVTEISSEAKSMVSPLTRWCFTGPKLPPQNSLIRQTSNPQMQHTTCSST